MPDGGAGGSPLLRPGDGAGGGGLGAALLQRGRHLHPHRSRDQEPTMTVHRLQKHLTGGRMRGYECCYALCCDIFLYTEYNFQNNFHVTMRVSCIQRTGRCRSLVVLSFTKWQVTQLRQNPFIMATVSSVSQTVASPARWWC